VCGTYGTCRGCERCLQTFGWEALREDLGIDGRINFNQRH
jgi:hypothetical protein